MNYSLKHREIQYIIHYASVLSHSVVDRWLYQNVQTVDFQLVALIIPQSLDLLNTPKGINLSHLCDIIFSQVFVFNLICLPPRVFEESEIKLGQDTC